MTNDVLATAQKRSERLQDVPIALASHRPSVINHFFPADNFRPGRKFRDRFDC